MLYENFFGADDVGGNGFFRVLVFEDLILNGVLADHTIGKHLLVLANAVGAVDGLNAGNPETTIFLLFG